MVAAARGALVQRTTEARLRLAERLVVSIGFLIAADILKTVVTPTPEGIGLLAGIIIIIIIIRTVLSLSIAYELRRALTPAQTPGPHAA